MLRKFSDWRKINEVEELTEIQLWGKYFNNIISVYRKYPGIRPSRDPKRYQNAKASKTLADFINSKGGGTSAEILISVINEWYDWPDQSSAKKVLIDYINNDDDLSNLSIGTGAASMPGDIITSLGGVNVAAKQFLKKFIKTSPKSLIKTLESSCQVKGKGAKLNEAVLGFIAAEL